MNTRSKKYRKSMEGFSPDKSMTLTDAFQQLSSFEKVNFDETIELSCSLGVDPKQSSQGVRGTINLPHGSGKDVKVIVFTDNTNFRAFWYGTNKLLMNAVFFADEM